ncbi:GSU2403 family nucleotidyltransferase fold protein [Rhodopseudomonas sp.]|uniref:GSU2403 family nucleotidyltransferase fold protein n=1 Tax=Rhodopseudomonas sp. TaxID=1078 RepID=UPI0039E2870F
MRKCCVSSISSSTNRCAPRYSTTRGISVIVPAPERYTIHKLIIATKWNVFSADKARKDINQTSALIQAFEVTRRASDLGFAWMEAWERGPRWRRRLAVGAMRLGDETVAILAKGGVEAAKLEGRGAPHEYGLGAGRTGLLESVAVITAASTPSP